MLLLTAREGAPWWEIRKIAAILVSDVVGYARLTGADEDRILARLRTLRSDLIDPTIAVHNGRVVKRTGDGNLVEFRSVVDAVRCAIEVQDAMVERNAGSGGRSSHRVQDRHSLGRRRRGSRRRPDGRQRQYRRAARGHRRARRDLSFRRRLPASERTARTRGQRSGPEGAQEHRRAGPGLFASRRPARSIETHAGPASEKSAAPRFSIVVLPFANIGDDPQQEYFVDGVTESLTTDLSRIRGVIVIARNTAFSYKGRPLDVRTMGLELNVRYVLEGSVQRSGGRMRVNVQLIDAERAVISGRSGSISQSPISLTCRTKSSPACQPAECTLIAAEARRSEQAPNPDSTGPLFSGCRLGFIEVRSLTIWRKRANSSIAR